MASDIVERLRITASLAEVEQTRYAKSLLKAAAHIEDQRAALRKAREAVVRLYCAAGCSCCRDDEGWEKWSAELARIFDIPAYDDGSGFQFYGARDEYDAINEQIGEG